MAYSWVRRTAGLIGVVLLLWMLPAITVASPSDKYLFHKETSTPVVPTSSDGAGDFPQPPLGMLGQYGYEFPTFTAHNDIAYVLEGNRLRVLSFADPANVTVITELFHTESFYSVQISPDGTRLFALAGSYFSTRNDTLLLYDVSNPAQPQLLTDVRSPFGQMHVYGNRLYLTTMSTATTAGALQVYSWENDQLSVLGETPMYVNDTTRMLFDAGVLVLASYDGTNSHQAITLYDISDDSAPEFKRTIQTIGGIAVPLNGYLYVSNGGYVDIWDIRNPDTASIVQTYGGYFVPLATHDNLILASGNRFYDVTTPTDIRLVGEADGFAFSRGLVWNSSGDIYTMQYAYPIRYLQRVTLTDTFQTIPVGDYKPPAYYAAVPVTERYLYLFGTTHSGIDIHDMQNPLQPRLVATVLQDHFTWPPTRDYFIVDGRLYLYRSGNIEVLDVTNPVAPILVTTIPLGSDWLLESVANGYLYALHNQSNRIRVLRLHDLEGQSIEFPGADRCSGLDTEGTMMVLACDDLHVYDITVPTAPVLVGTLPTSLALLQPTLELPSLYVTSLTQTAIYDLSNPASPRYVTSVPAPFPLSTEGAAPDEHGSFVCAELVPLEPALYLRQCIFRDNYPPESQWVGPADIVDLSNPASPQRSESMYAPFARGVVQGDTLVVADERLSVWHIRGFLDQATFMPLVGKESP